MKCEKCGSFIPDGASWCPSCGSAAEKAADKGAAAIADAVRVTLDEREAEPVIEAEEKDSELPAVEKKKSHAPAVVAVVIVAVLVAGAVLLAPRLTGDTDIVTEAETARETILLSGVGGAETDLLTVDDTDASGAAVKGTVTYYNGAVYTGDLSEGKRIGHGKIVYPDGKSFDGLWKDDAFEYGTYTYTDGSYYTGTFASGVRSGDGELYDSDGTLLYKGSFKDDVYSGEGTLYAEDGEYTGTFADGSPVKCTVTYKDGGVYSGSLENMKPQGEGEMKYASGERYYGQWKNGELYNGAYTYSNGCVYTGDFLNGEKCGAGKLEYPDGAVYEGTFQNDTYLDGTLIFADGTVHQGEFEHGALVRGSITVGNMIYAGQFESGTLVSGTVTYPDGHTENVPAE